MRELSSEAALVEQAKGVLILRYGVTPGAAGRLLGIWAQTAGVTSTAVAHTLVHHICVDLPCPDPVCPDLGWLERWIEGRLRTQPPEGLVAEELV